MLKGILKPKEITGTVGLVGIFILTGLALFFTLFFSFVDYNRKFEKQLENLNLRLDQIEKGFIKSLSNSLWKIDDEQTQIILNIILSQEDIEQIRVLDDSKELFLIGNKVDPKNAIVRVYPLVVNFDDSKRYIGDLEVVATKRNMKKLLYDEIKFFLITEFVKVMAFGFFALIFIKIVITRHLDTITEFFKTGDIYNSQKKLFLNREFEFWKNSEDNFDILINSINDMQGKLHEELQVRKKTEYELTQINEYLERRVEEKTNQLLEADRIESVVEMSVGIAHEINSPLSVVYTANKRIGRIIETEKIENPDLVKIHAILSSSIDRIFSITNALHMLSNTSETNHIGQVNSNKLIQTTMTSLKEVFKSGIKSIEFVTYNLESEIFVNQNLFYQTLYMLLNLRSKGSSNKNAGYWVRLEFSHEADNLVITCFDNGDVLSTKERKALLNPFRSIEQRDRGSLLLLGTLSSMIHKMNAKINTIDYKNDVFIQIQIPTKG